MNFNRFSLGLFNSKTNNVKRSFFPNEHLEQNSVNCQLDRETTFLFNPVRRYREIGKSQEKVLIGKQMSCRKEIKRDSNRLKADFLQSNDRTDNLKTRRSLRHTMTIVSQVALS